MILYILISSPRYTLFIDGGATAGGGSQCKNAVTVVLISAFIVVGGVALIILLLVRPSIRNNPEVRTSYSLFAMTGNQTTLGQFFPYKNGSSNDKLNYCMLFKS